MHRKVTLWLTHDCMQCAASNFVEMDMVLSSHDDSDFAFYLLFLLSFSLSRRNCIPECKAQCAALYSEGQQLLKNVSALSCNRFCI